MDIIILHNIILKVLNEEITSDTRREFHTFTVWSTNKLWKALVQAKGWWRNYLLVHWPILGLSMHGIQYPEERNMCRL